MKSFNFHNGTYKRLMLVLAASVLLILSFISEFYFQTQPSIVAEQRKLENHIRKQQHDFRTVMSDSALIGKLLLQKESLEEFRAVVQKTYGIYLYREDSTGGQQLLFWNDQNVVPPPEAAAWEDGEYFQRLENGYYVVEKRTIRLPQPNDSVKAYAMIPVLHRYEIETKYFYTHFAHSREAIKMITITNAATQYPIRSLGGAHLFSINRNTYNQLPVNDTVTVLLRLSALVLLLVYIHLVAAALTRKKGIIIGCIFLTSVLVMLRLLMYLLPAIFYFRQFPLFDPSVYAANWLNRSLGDLLLNAILFCWIVVFSWFALGPRKRLPYFLHGRKLIVAMGALGALFVLVWTTFQLANVVRSLVADSKISFYVTDFFSLDIYTGVGFVVLALLSLAYYYFTRLLFRLIFPAFERPIYVYFLLAAVGLIYLTLKTGTSIVLFHIPVLIWLILYTLLLSQEQFLINRFRVTTAGILFWIFIFSVSLAGVILQENRAKEWISRRGIAEKYDQLTDPSSERTLSIGLRYLDNRFLSKNFYRFVDPGQNRYLRDSIIRENISSGYISKYNTKIFVFDALRRGINNNEATSYAELNNIFSVQSKPTGIPDLYYHETSYDQFTYITKKVISDSVRTIGTFFIISTPKRYNADALYPELLRQINRDAAENSPIYSYAVYSNNLLTSASSKYPFRTSLTAREVPKYEYERRINGDYDELWYKVNNSKVIVVAKTQDSLIESITLFSYLFCSFLIMIALLEVLSVILKAGYDARVLSDFWQFNIRSQVHGTIIFVSVLSFVIIAIATISFFVSRYNRNNIDKLSRTSGIMVREMQKSLASNEISDSVTRVYDSASNYSLQQMIEEVSDIHNVDINVYDLEGNLKVTSEPNVYSKGILSIKMHPEAYYHLRRLRHVQFVQQETMSSLRYLSIYAAVRNEKGIVYAYLNIPYFLSQIDLYQEISNFLLTIINLNAFIFLIAGTIALFITNKITRSFSIIGDKMKEITLGKTNEEIEWNRRDEIGELVKQYNKMVQQLGQSAEALAKSEREGAWREMARQVAHEIKNPLTPMKLSIQYLQKAINNNQENVKELTTNVANTLVEQIDHLSKIAADFSRFANIGNRNLEVFDLHAVLESLRDLYGANPNLNMIWERTEGEVMMKADKTHMNRLFTNLLTNAIDACENQAECRIEMIETRKEHSILIQVRDNGEGIDEAMKPKIFTPNFTTKTSGTGLGLAMCKSIAEQAGGSIWFQTEKGTGTTFFVELPVLS